MQSGRLLVTVAVVTGLVAAATQVPAAPTSADRGDRVWKPHVRTAKRYAKHRAGAVSFAIFTRPQGMRGLHSKHTSSTASLIKAMLLVACLRQRDVRDRRLRAGERHLLRPMIRRSDNAAASTVNAIIGGRIYGVARAARMRDFHWEPNPWGASRSSPRDQARFFHRLPRLVPRRHRGYALRQLRRIVPAQRWGVARVSHRGWRLYFKGGWGSGSGAVNHQSALLRRGRRRIGIAIFTDGSPSHAYGKQTLRGVARRLLRGLPD